jgi:ubiquinone/menaquinone biosynthesis C-methylase UbiE
MIEKVNYNKISPVYNDRYKQSKLEGVEEYISKLVQFYKPGNILEVGCGTAHWLNILTGFNCNLFGADYSLGMLNMAGNRNSSIKLFNANALNLPLKKSSFDMIYVVNAIHHFGSPFKFINDSIKYLKTGGIFVVIGLEPRESKNNWYMYKFFSRTYEIDINRFPTFNEIEKNMADAGYSTIKNELVHKIDIVKRGNEILQDHFLTKKGASQLAMLSDEEYELGLNKIQNTIKQAEAENSKADFEIKLNFYAISGIKSSS